MKKVRNILILLLAAIMLTVFVGCNPDDGLDNQLPPEDGGATVVDPKTFAGFKAAVLDNLPSHPNQGEPLQYNTLTDAEKESFIKDATAAGYTVEFKKIKDGILFLVGKDSIQVQQQVDGKWYHDDFNFKILADKIDGAVDGIYDLPNYPQYKYTPEAYRPAFIEAAAKHSPAWVADFSDGFKLSIDNDITFVQTKADWIIDDTTYSNKVKIFDGSDFTVLGSDLFAMMTDYEFATLKKYLPNGWYRPVIDKDAKTFSVHTALDKVLEQGSDGKWIHKTVEIDPNDLKTDLIITALYVNGNDKVVALTNVSGADTSVKGYSLKQTNGRNAGTTVKIGLDAILGKNKTLYLIDSYGQKSIKETFDCVKNAETNGDLVAVVSWDLCSSKGGNTNLMVNDGNHDYDSTKIVIDGKVVDKFEKYHYYLRQYNADPKIQNWTVVKIENNDEAKAAAKTAFSAHSYFPETV